MSRLIRYLTISFNIIKKGGKMKNHEIKRVALDGQVLDILESILRLNVQILEMVKPAYSIDMGEKKIED